jgi:hypothetical protein
VKATKAYIAGVGTTGLLVASSLLVLTVMSALVAFRGFPGPDVQDPVQSILVETAHAPATVAVPATDSASVRAIVHGSPAASHGSSKNHSERTRSARPKDNPRAPVAVSQPRVGAGATSPVPATAVPAPAVPSPSLPGAPAVPKVTIPPPSDLVPPPADLGQPVSAPVDQTVHGVNDTTGALLGR